MSLSTLSKPDPLKEGDRVRLIASASPFKLGVFRAGQNVLEGLGLVPVVSRSEFARDGFLAGSDRRRAENLQRALLEDDTKAGGASAAGMGRRGCSRCSTCRACGSTRSCW